MKRTIDQVYTKIKPYLKVTPLKKSEALSNELHQQLYFKMENEQITGSFKLRGVLSKFSELKERGVAIDQVVAASTGNHALAVCHAAKAFQSQPIIFVPESISESKFAQLISQGVRLFKQGEQSGETEQLAIRYAKEHNIPLIHPYNDPEVIAGQGTIGLELIQHLHHMDTVFVPVGGGGLISGIGSYIKDSNPKIRIVGVQPKNACEMADSIDQGRIVEASRLSTISDGTAGGLDPDTITYQYCKQLVDQFIRVEEGEILAALKLMQRYLKVQVEPAAGLALAGILQSKASMAGSTSVAIVCGGNIDVNRYQALMKDV